MDRREHRPQRRLIAAIARRLRADGIPRYLVQQYVSLASARFGV